ncbi:MAG: AAA family ATPase [Pseudorhodobacter sp.]|nr:AAA family ATPase [Rhizobacter sp.]
MILQHFGLGEAPFGLTPDTSFVYPSRAHSEAFDTLMVALEQGDGFIKITGEVGTGKTFLCRRMLGALGALQSRYTTLFLPNPCTQPRGLLLALCHELGLSLGYNPAQYKLLPALTDALLKHAVEGRTVVVCLDEAQAMPDEVLECLRLLTNIEGEKHRLLRVVMFGQPELDVKLAQPHMRQLTQRISFHYKLTALSDAETLAYLNHRLRVAGHRGATVFGAREAKLMHRLTAGTPRLINLVAHKALMLAYGSGEIQVSSAHVRAAAQDTPATAQRGWVPRWEAVRAAMRERFSGLPRSGSRSGPSRGSSSGSSNSSSSGLNAASSIGRYWSLS